MSSRLRVVALAAALALAACGRTGLLGPDAETDADGDADSDSDSDADGDTDSDADGGPGCSVPVEPTVVHSDVAPGFVMSLVRLPDEHYVLSASYGWPPDDQLYLWALDGRTLEVAGRTAVDQEMLTISYDPRGGTLRGVAHTRNAMTYLGFAIGARWAFERRDARWLCDECYPGYARPLVGPGVVGVPAELWRSDTTEVAFVPEDPDEEILWTASGLEGSSPLLVLGSFGPLLLRIDPEGLLGASQLYWDGSVEPEPEVIPVGPSVLAFDALGRRGEDVVVAAAVSDGSGVHLELCLLGGTGRFRWSLPVDDDPELVTSLSLAEGDGTLAVAWGESVGRGRIGAHLLVVDADDLSPIYGPALVSPPSDQLISSYTFVAAVAAHDDGFVVLWNGWHELAYYGIYGVVARCWP